MPYKITIYDNIPACLEGLKEFIKQYPDFQTVGTFTNFQDLLHFLNNNNTDILILDLKIPKKSAHDAIRFIHNKFPDIKIVIITENKNEFDIFNAIKAGALAYLYKPNTNKQELLNALNNVVNNEDYFNEPISNIIIQSYVKNAKKGDEISHRNPKNLTRREIQILQLICEGLTSKQIADGLFISVRTVEVHKMHIMQKLGIKSTAELVKFAIKHGYVKL